ncbi:GNAT family N-acetyltransferase [Dinoroseobacter sp. S375]|uniref:GNAT family N-acetyltransferase n=1 Tax=Dinoroseobacter sp. S375 TaxID=3415136 RepID=UPI003C7C1902
MQLRQEQTGDWWEVEALFDLCFAPGREALSSYRLRDGVPPVAELCLVAPSIDNVLGGIGGAIRFWPIRVGGQEALLLGPVAVHPTRQGEGLGALLIQAGLEKAASLGWTRVLLVGDAPYYSRFGFARAEGVEMPPPTNPDRVLIHALSPGAWDGVQGVVTAAA